MKFIRRLGVFLLLSAAILYLMYRYGFLDFSYIAAALKHGKRWVVMAFVAQTALALCGVMRFRGLLGVFGVRPKTSDVAAATFVSTAVGQWAPGSLAVMELLRVGLMIGAGKHAEQKGQLNPVASLNLKFGLKARIAASSLFDRLLGFCLILGMGALVSFYLLASEDLTAHRQFLLAALGVVAFLGAVFIMLLPAIAKSRWPSAQLVRFLVQLRKRRAQPQVHKAYRFLFKVFKRLNILKRVIAHAPHHPSAYLVPAFWSLGVSLSTCLGLFFSSLAIGTPISFLAILAVFPVQAVSALLPIGFAGVGGQQLVAVAVFDIFLLNAASVASASLLQNIISVITNTLLGLLFAHLSAAQIRAIFRSKQAALLTETTP